MLCHNCLIGTRVRTHVRTMSTHVRTVSACISSRFLDNVIIVRTRVRTRGTYTYHGTRVPWYVHWYAIHVRTYVPNGTCPRCT